ncbi:pap2-domain-containing protein [Lichtheimia corymbifera JMRC:FSU:9682]|uniref:Pap2-domain-containing protein n=1 Tax=Lichtheimia corymbifera JMRC:FSU:9682 TaxID=1263082 RepID=A0A068SD07_9FUNG|nr:pap2-domain-containing protein [Lichtheimia corymbifera JMRC:FSU:9682]
MFSQHLKNPRKRRVVLSYAQDWLLVIVMIGVFFAIDVIPPFHREFSLQDKSIMYTYTAKESIPAWTLALICFLGPIIAIGFIAWYFQRSMHDFHSGVLGLFLALSMVIMLTDVIKITAGRPRPDFLARCQPPLDAEDPPRGLSNYTICTTPIDSYEMKDGYKSFPSGHASFSFAGLGYLAFYLAGKMQLFDERGHTYKCFLFAFPSLAALLVAISRTRDYRHHWQDVFIGGLLGAGCAYFAYRQYYPSLIHVECHNPYSARLGSCSDDPEQQQQLPAPGTTVYTSHEIEDNSLTTASSQLSDDRYKHSYPVR